LHERFYEEARMRKLAVVLTVLAALSFLGGICRILFARMAVSMGLLGVSPETYWRGATGLLLFAVVILMLDRSRAR